MTSYLKSWLWNGTVSAESSAAPPQQPVPTLQTTSPQASDDEGSDTETELDVKVEVDDDDDDVAPAFPSLNSAQRVQSNKPSTSVPKILSDSQLMPPPPVPSLAVRRPGVPAPTGSSSLQIPSRAGGLGSSLAVPPSTTKPPPKPSKKREKVALAPGHSAMDWANLKASGADLRGVDTLLRVTPSMLKLHNKKDDAWSAFYGKVYNITPYIPFHPGGERDLMRVAGRDGTKLFATTHGWVNADFMLDACLVGFLVPEPSS